MLHDMLEGIKSDPDAVPLTPLSTKFLQTAPNQRAQFVTVYRENPLKRQVGFVKYLITSDFHKSTQYLK